MLPWWPLRASVWWGKSLGWGGRQVDLDAAPGADSSVVLTPGVHALASSGEEKQLVKGLEAGVILPFLLTCSVTPEEDPNLSGPRFSPLVGKGLYFPLGSGR